LNSTATTWNYQSLNVASGIFAFIMLEFRGAVVSGNSVAVGGDESVLVIDA
jgi:hypothetical protein